MLAPESRSPHLLGLRLTQQHTIGAEHDGKPFVSATGGQIEEVFSQQRLATGQDQEDIGVGHSDVVDDPCDTPPWTAHDSYQRPRRRSCSSAHNADCTAG